jgi:hypothetical protein
LNVKNYKHQITNNKWFDKLTTLSPVEGQYPNSKLQKIPLTPFRKGETGLDLPEEFSSV